MKTWVDFFRNRGRVLLALVVVLLAAGCNRSVAPPPEGTPDRITGASASGAAKAVDSGSAQVSVSTRSDSKPPENERPRGSATLETAVLAGGCFWGMEDILRKIPGVLETEVGYTGGSTVNPTYNDVHLGTTGHAEAVRIVFDPKRLSYADLLEQWFFKMHDPTTKDRQGNDVGSQYRSAIFTTSPEQHTVAESVKARVDRSGNWKAPIVTQIVEAGVFTPAESYHQDYLEKVPGGYTCHYLRSF
jgi:peptide methionine sulfoxide reductase msrA/msrB